MIHSNLPAEASGLPVQGPHWHRQADLEDPRTFTPLRLVLQPSGFIFAMTRPEMLVGRHSDADIRLPLPDVSRRHCRFVFAEGCWHVFDLNSLNGLFINGERVQEAVVHAGDRIHIGGFIFVVEMDADKQSQSDPAQERQIAGSILRSIVDSLPEQRRAS